ncbi:hypothetical protein [Staphylococcus pettenkoferi]|uniref:hypothetical protein n=1 Tax=Staphylococcus pettenkoferi TaxID=170573 RepID=UPI001F5932B5|nr:hypothetical protein [Staphylococcus pettenkoferi]MCI2802780.1 hypothetical protein [Staphylococcus pettenkoferi]
MEPMRWKIKTDIIENVSLNIGEYSSIYDEYATQEEDILEIINCYFQKRNSNKNEVTIYDEINQEDVSYSNYQSFIFSHEMIEKEHSLAASTIMAKKLNRLMKDTVEIEGYFNSINVMLEDMIDVLECELPIRPKHFDYKAFIKLLSFEYELTQDYSRLIVRLEQMIPLLIEELNKQTNNQTLLIYYYPEANLSPKEQVRFANLLKSLPATVIVLTGSSQFLSENLSAMNYIRESAQMITDEFIDNLVWEAPLVYEREEVISSLERFIKTYQSKFELNPTISNYQLHEIMLFEEIDLYVGVRFMAHIRQNFELDIQYTQLSKPIQAYLKTYDTE